MNYKEVIFNGKYMCKDQCRGVQRYLKEVLHAIDKMPEAKEIKVIVPHKVKQLDHFENIEVTQYGGRITPKFWQYIGFQFYVWTHHALAINLADPGPIWMTGISAIHDVRYLEDLKKKLSLKTRLSLMFVKHMMDRTVHNSIELITVSEFSKREITKKYRIDPNKISVCYNAWQHLNSVGFDDSIFNTHPELEKGQYYFSLGGSEESKNMLWILRMIQKYPDRMFAMAGPQNLYFPTEGIDLNKYKNFVHLGYVSDEEMKSLMKNCKAFLFPSKYEGFGIPPMEAISVGAKALVSNAACLPEIYKSYVSYFKPDDYDADLDELLEKCPDNTKDVLMLYSWDDTARKIVEIIKKFARI